MVYVVSMRSKGVSNDGPTERGCASIGRLCVCIEKVCSYSESELDRQGVFVREYELVLKGCGVSYR